MSHKLMRAAILALLASWPALSQAQVEKLSEAELAKYRADLPAVLDATQITPLKGQLQRLVAKDTPEAKLALANALRVANDLKGATGNLPLAYYAVPAMSELQRLPDAYPLDGKAMSPVTIIAAQDEYEAGSFVVYPFSTLGKIKFELGAFKTSDNKIFPKENLDLKFVKVWYQNGNGWYSYFGDTGLKLTPELLLNDEDLIKVDTKKVQNYARLTEKDGKVSYDWITPPLAFDNRYEEHYRHTSSFRPMMENFADAKTLQPVALNDGEFKQFFLTANVTDKIQPGLYSGEVRLFKDKEQVGTIPVMLKVLPFKLPEPKAYFDTSKDFLVASYNYTSFALIAEENGGDLQLAEKQILAVFKNLKAHNQTLHWVRGKPYDYEYFRQIELLKEAGMKTDPLLAGGNIQGTDGNELLMSRAARLDKKYNMEKLGHNNVFVGYGDEPGAGWVMKARPVFEAYQKEGFKFIIAGNKTVFFKAGYLYDFFNNAKAPEDSSAPEPWNQVGKAWVAWYAVHHVGPENPAFNRRQYGIAPYLANYSALCNYAHHFGSYNDRSTTYKPMVFAYGSYDGVIDTIQWEGFREGIDDIRYATLLKTLAQKGAASENLEVQYAARQALQFFAELDPASSNMNTARLEMINQILKLRKMLQEK
ncbi:MAG: hypothetical protein A2X49_00610 [Lentisphaerae bacterium GWF2_52_8]|nr:MAG: hypothetical protein A2X49_00610 [Lentisphaerae bacterium GWF2_52_8]